MEELKNILNELHLYFSNRELLLDSGDTNICSSFNIIRSDIRAFEDSIPPVLATLRQYPFHKNDVIKDYRKKSNAIKARIDQIK